MKKIPFHPLIFALYPVLALLANNLDQLAPQNALRSAGLALLGGVLLYALFWRILGKPGRAALLAAGWLVLFFSYGHVYQLVEGRAVFGWVIGKHRFLVPVWAGLLVAGSYGIVKLKSTREWNVVLNVTSLALLFFPLAQIVWFGMRAQQLAAPSVPRQPVVASQSTSAGSSPDIYYIVLDGYSRSDVVEKLYGLDITPTLQELKAIGFVIPECAQSNYGITAFSMFASLNMEYLDADPGTFPLGSELDKVDYQAMREYLRHSQARQYLEAQGYQMITFETGFWWLNIDDTGVYIVENNNPLKRYSSAYSLSNFEDLLIRSTALRVLAEANAAWLSPLTRKVITPTQQHYEWVRFAFDQLDQVPQMEGKKFVYFHVLAPHDPFVFAPDGSYLFSPNSNSVPGSDVPGYPNELKYINQRIVQIVRKLIADSPTPPIIIIQGDHGWDPRYRMQILNAYYLPEGGSELVYPTITPVNTFRMVFDRYLGGSFGLLEDQSYFSMGSDFPQYGVRSRPYQLTPVPNTCLGDVQ